MIREMWSKISPFLLSITLHVAIFGMMVLGLNFQSLPKPAGGDDKPPLQAMVIDETQVAKELERLRSKEVAAAEEDAHEHREEQSRAAPEQ